MVLKKNITKECFTHGNVEHDEQVVVVSSSLIKFLHRLVGICWVDWTVSQVVRAAVLYPYKIYYCNIFRFFFSFLFFFFTGCGRRYRRFLLVVGIPLFIVTMHLKCYFQRFVTHFSQLKKKKKKLILYQLSWSSIRN